MSTGELRCRSTYIRKREGVRRRLDAGQGVREQRRQSRVDGLLPALHVGLEHLEA